MLVVVVVHQLPPGTSQARGRNACSGSVLATSPSLQPWGALSWLPCPCAADSQAHGVPGLGNGLPVCLQAVLTRIVACFWVRQPKWPLWPLAKGSRAPWSGLSHQEMPKGWKFPSCPKPQPPACDIGDGCQPGSIHGPEGLPHFQEIPDSLGYPSTVWPSPKDSSMAWRKLKSPYIHPLSQN